MKEPKENAFEPLDSEEAQIMAEVERGEWKPVNEKLAAQMLSEGKEMAKRALAKAGRISIRVNDNDLEGLKSLAANAGIPTHTYIGMLLHKVVTGQIELK